ncbi:MAG: hypothetical protein DLM57_00280 [Pseudonocardiales bacterium]|nr:MAG: hypothetical protein DLM57_00280 [Pseudonocardiales bacterium]
MANIGANIGGMPLVRAITDDGTTWDDPAPARIAALLGDVGREGGEGRFLILERCADVSGHTYLQALRVEAGTYVVEFRDGSADRHYRAYSDAATVRAVLTAWASDAATWRDMLPWQHVEQPS